MHLCTKDKPKFIAFLYECTLHKEDDLFTVQANKFTCTVRIFPTKCVFYLLSIAHIFQIIIFIQCKYMDAAIGLV